MSLLDGSPVDVDQGWKGVEKMLGQPLGPPVVYSKSGTPLPSTRFFGYSCGVILEVCLYMLA